MDITSQGEQNTVEAILIQMNLDAWIGLSRNLAGNMVWTDGSSPTFTYWNDVSEPLAGNDCVYANTSPW